MLVWSQLWLNTSLVVKYHCFKLVAFNLHLGTVGDLKCSGVLILCYQDAHEFLSQCLDQLKEDVEKVNKSCKSESMAWEEPQGTRLTDEPDISRIYTCPVTVNMEFEVLHTITCKR